MMNDAERWLLVVEDNPDDEYLARRAFSAINRDETLMIARHGEEALEMLAARESPVLVLLDLKLPRLSGVEVLMAMKDDRRLSTIPVVVLSSSNEISDIGACYELGCNAFVRKPIDYDSFITALSSTLNFWLSVNITLGDYPNPPATNN
jgi:two-component system response regulator